MTSDRATEEMAFEETDGTDEDDDATAREDDEDATVPVSSAEEDTEEHPCDEDEPEDDDEADPEGAAVLVLVLIGTFGLFRLLTLPPLEELLLLLPVPLLEELDEAGFTDDPEPGAAARVGPLFCWPVGAAPTFGAGMF